MPPVPKKELWIDLHLLVDSSCAENGHASFFWEWNDEHPCPGGDFKKSILFPLRQILRSLGYKITDISYGITHETWKDKYLSIKTNIPDKVYNATLKDYNEFVHTWDENWCHEDGESQQQEEAGASRDPDDPAAV